MVSLSPGTAVAGSPPCLPSPLLADLRACRSMPHLQQLHAAALKTARLSDQVIASEILRYAALSTDGDLSYARRLFDEMTHRNHFAWNTIIRGFSENQAAAHEGFSLFRRMLLESRSPPDRYTYPSALKACAEALYLEEGRQAHCLAVKSGLDSDGFVATSLARMYTVCGRMKDAEKLLRSCPLPSTSDASAVLANVIVDGYAQLGRMDAAREVFDGMPHRTVVSWNGMVAGYVRNCLFKEAVELFRRMMDEGGTKPNHSTLVSVLPAISRLGALELGKWVHAYAERNGIVVEKVLGTALIHMYAKCGSIDRAIKVFQELPGRGNSVTLSVLIGGLALHGRASDALDYFSKMVEAGIAPTDVVFIGVLNACSHAGLVERGRAYFDQMVEVYGMKPRIEHYGCMVDMLGRAGRLAEAEELILNMPVKPDDVILKSLLASCKVHGNVEIGMRIAKLLMDLASRDGGSYVLLSNLYASVGDWDSVAKVRLLMKERDVRKDPGCSWITIDGTVHEFVVEDDSHPKLQEIRSMLEELSSKVGCAGYTPDTSQVLLNIDEEEKQSLLSYHSEKIAIAFGIISTSPGNPLQVIKNLRVCTDCHSWLKAVSKIYNRKIVVRDRSRFHHFQDGCCSCNDYW